MLRRAPSQLTDTTDASQWRVGGPDAPVDALLIVAANDEKTVADRAAALRESAAGAGLATACHDTGRGLEDREHFGFRDGISQPFNPSWGRATFGRGAYEAP
jgi:deferrochelatase/peroxidase EfeB